MQSTRPVQTKPGRFLVLAPCGDCEKAEAKARTRGRPDAHMAACAFHTTRRAEPEPLVGFRLGLVRRNVAGVSL
jgi:hypothetical protein